MLTKIIFGISSFFFFGILLSGVITLMGDFNMDSPSTINIFEGIFIYFLFAAPISFPILLTSGIVSLIAFKKLPNSEKKNI